MSSIFYYTTPKLTWRFQVKEPASARTSLSQTQSHQAAATNVRHRQISYIFSNLMDIPPSFQNRMLQPRLPSLALRPNLHLITLIPSHPPPTISRWLRFWSVEQPE